MTTNVNKTEDQTYLTPQQHAARIYDEGEFFAVIWDANPFRLAKRITECMKLGYILMSNVVSHTQFEETGGSNHMRVPNRSVLVVFMFHQELYDKVRVR